MEPINVNDADLWKTLATIFGPGGLVLLLTNAGAWYATWLIWKRLKEKDAECQTEMDKQETRSETRFQQMRSDIKEAFGIVGTLSERVTVLVERTANTRTRDS